MEMTLAAAKNQTMTRQKKIANGGSYCKKKNNEKMEQIEFFLQ
jgi:hypothetical protein